jgi:hypothetical protein
MWKRIMSCGKKGGKKRKKNFGKNQKKGFKNVKRINLTIKRGWQDSQVWGWGGEGPEVDGSRGKVT